MPAHAVRRLSFIVWPKLVQVPANWLRRYFELVLRAVRWFTKPVCAGQFHNQIPVGARCAIQHPPDLGFFLYGLCV